MTNAVKTLFAAAIVAVAGSAAFAGPNYIRAGEAQSLGKVVNLDIVRADTASTVNIYDFHAGQRGELLGSAHVTAGANSDVKVHLTRPAFRDTLAVLSNGSSEVAITEVSSNR
ncbi:hypothetical protein [Celeribacter indicus]|uniref:Uncharacterized protein n=1 Tax=Celeribacter indicus TaxID=1208324 RepID=A0A0B5DPH5_9RHOB|nr:hypothetical protein [Celeribacter indicus]AJE45488.1 hypothetical protein P73_0773 [Celeribacter indicus]SDW87746.1 hypothetical protein SAMN05443573_108163 [Celeribacter indicus]